MNSSTIAFIDFFMATGIIGFWIYFFLVENKNPKKSEIYFAYERSFPLPDLVWVAPCLIIAGIGMLSTSFYGVILNIAGGGALIFLGLVDIAFNYKNGGYSSNIGDTILNIVINTTCLIMGPILIIFNSAFISM